MEALPLCAASCGVFTRLFRRRFDAPNVGHIHALLASRNKTSVMILAESHLQIAPKLAHIQA